MITGSITIQDAATPNLQYIASVVKRPRGLFAAVGKRVEKDYRAHFLAKDRQGNAKGWPRTHFWNRVRSATALTSVSDAGAELTIASPEFVHKIKGGTVTPKRGRFLAIPLTARAAAAGSPREGGIEGLFVIGRRGGKGRYLAIKEGGAIRVMYRLLTSVTHRPDPTALLPEEALHAGVNDEANKYLTGELARRAAAKGGSR